MERKKNLLKISEHPQWMEKSALWFHQKWHIPLEDYQKSMKESIQKKNGIPCWYIVVDENDNIIAGAGVIENDFHQRPDFTPNVCALYVEENMRHQGIARFLLNAIREDMFLQKIDTLYLVTDHTCFYEKCGWEFLTMVKDLSGELERMYVAITKERKESK